MGLEESVHDSDRTDEIGFLDEAVHATGDDVERVIPRDVTSHSVLDPVTKQTFLRSRETVMKQMQVGEGIGLPAQHVRFDFIDRVPPGSRPQAADSVPAGTPIDLGCSPNMESRICLELQLSGDIVVDFSAADSEFGISLEVREAFLEIVRGKAQVSVELHNEIPVGALEIVVAVIKRLHHSATGFPEASIRTVYNAYPWMLRRISIGDFAGLVRRPIVNNHPLSRAYRLASNALDGGLDVFLLVTSRSDNDVSGIHRLT